MTMNEQKLQEFCDLITAQRRDRLIKEGCTYEIHRENYTAHYHMGSKFVRVDIGGSGKYMVELLTGQIYGIKGYGVVHRGHCFGTLDTINDWNWSGYRAFKTLDRLKARYDFSAPALDKDDLFAAGIADIRKGDSDRKSTRLNSSHANISYAVFCL